MAQDRFRGRYENIVGANVYWGDGDQDGGSPYLDEASVPDSRPADALFTHHGGRGEEGDRVVATKVERYTSAAEREAWLSAITTPAETAVLLAPESEVVALRRGVELFALHRPGPDTALGQIDMSTLVGGHTMLRLVGRALPEFRHLPTLVGYDHASGLAVADLRGEHGSLTCLLAQRSTRWHMEIERADMLHAVRRSPTAAGAAVRAALARHFMLPGGEMQAASLMAEGLVLLPYALVPVPLAPPRSAPTLSLGSALADGVTIDAGDTTAGEATTWRLRAEQLRLLNGHVWAKSATVTVTREAQAVGTASGPDGGWCIVATRRPLLKRLHTIQKELLEEAAAKPVGTCQRE